MNKGRLFLLILLVFALLFSVTGCDSVVDSGLPNQATTLSTSNLKIVSWSGSEGDISGQVTIEGTVKNTSGTTLSYAQIEARLYDTNGTRIGSGMDNVSNLRAGKSWQYEMFILVDPWEVESIELEVGSSPF